MDRKRIIKTERLTLTPIDAEDRAELIALLSDEEVGKTYMLPSPMDEVTAGALFTHMQKLSEREDRYVFALRLLSELIGVINDTCIENSEIEIGYAISPAYKNQGYMSEAVGALIEYLFSIGYGRVVAGAFSENSASIRVMEKCGMHRIEKTEKIEYRGKMHDCIYYAIEKSK